MEDMDIDPVVEIPDTPDRPAGRHTNAGNHAGKEIKFSVARYSRNPRFIEEEHFSQPRARGWPGDESGYNRRLPMHSRKNYSNVDEIDSHFNSIPSSPLENSFASRNASLFRRTAVDKNIKHRSRDTSEAAEVGRGKVKYSNFASKSSTSRDYNDNVNSNDQTEHVRMLEMAFPHGRSKETLNKEIKEGQIATNAGSLNSQNCSKTSNKNLSKGKEKVEDNTSRCADSIMDLGKGLNLSGDSQFNNAKQISEYHHSAVSPRVSGHKRLVRNGCISPHNISVRAKQLAERSQNGFNGVEQNHANNVVASAPCMVDINEIVSENQKRPQGIRVRSCSSKDRDPEIVHLSASSTINDQGNGNSHASKDASGCLEVLGGWRSTQNRSRRGDHTSSEEHSNHFRSSDDGSFVLGQRGHGDNQSGTNFWSRHPNVAQTASRHVFNVDQTSQSRVAANALTKRQRHREATSRNNGESSRTVPDDSDIMFLGSSVESSRPRSSRIQSNQFPGIVDVDELSSETRHSDTQADDLDARARQLEADEMMARELQEQLYSESPVFGSGGVDEGIAWLVQQEEDELRNQLRHGHPRTSTRSNRQPHPRPMQNPSNRRAQVRFRSSAGTSQSRSRLPYRTRAAPSRTRNIPFPLNMDIEMRLDILEMLEAVAGDVNDVGPTGNIFQLQRDFNENDYEMLLALDENNHLNGASASQINNLPLSTVQSDNYDEVCAICLETPTVGESIRHLPCLHKFHKDCIDPWLNRKSSCPVCKSSVS